MGKRVLAITYDVSLRIGRVSNIMTTLSSRAWSLYSLVGLRARNHPESKKWALTPRIYARAHAALFRSKMTEFRVGTVIREFFA